MNLSFAKILPFIGFLLFSIANADIRAQLKVLGATGEQWIGGAAGSAGGIRFEVILKKPASRVILFDSVYVGYADSGQWVAADLAMFQDGKWIVGKADKAPRKLDTFQLRCSVTLIPACQKPVFDQDIIYKEHQTPWVKPPIPVSTKSTDRILLIRYRTGKKTRYLLVEAVVIKKVLVP